jgi:pectate lyase
LQFSATVQGTVSDKSVTWKAASGAISASGAYTAPSQAGTDTVTATSNADATKSASGSVTVAAPVVSSVSISPASTSTTTGGTLQFSATVQGTVSDKSVTWKAASGTISAGGAYTAPSQAGADTVTATSNADATKSATARVTVSEPTNKGALPAFPGAQGGGAAAVGGRGGQVFEITNLNDSGSGSLRDCLQASGPRTCIFRVAGIITPLSRLQVNNPFLTIACQTAPGEIIIGGPNISGESIFISTHDVIVRYCTFSSDNINVPPGPATGTMNVAIANGDNYNIILDHITTRWAGNKLWAALSNYVGPNRLITTQWSMFYEPHAGHPVGPGTGTNPGCSATASSPCFSAGEHDIDFHHNLFADMNHRIPENTNYSTRWVNNIVFNWGYYASAWLGAMHVDEIGNKYVPGNLNSQAQKYEIHFTANNPPLPGNPSVYLSGNVGPNQPDPNGNQYAMANEITGENGDEIGPLPSDWIRSSPMANTTFPIAADSVTNLDSILLPTVGNSQHLDCNGNWVSHRDPADARIINQYQTGGPGGFWPNGLAGGTSSIPTPASDWTDQPVTNFSTCTESQHDGIPDQWKLNQGLSTTDPSLYNAIASNGYTYLENYMNGPGGSASLTRPHASSTSAAARPTSGGASFDSWPSTAHTSVAMSGGERGHF